jgi:hypothetical protein
VAAAVEYAVEHLEVRDIIVCGHSVCGAMKALYREQEMFAATPHIGQWLRHGDRTMAVVAANYPDRSREERYEITAEESVLLQMGTCGRTGRPGSGAQGRLRPRLVLRDRLWGGVRYSRKEQFEPSGRKKSRQGRAVRPESGAFLLESKFH